MERTKEEIGDDGLLQGGHGWGGKRRSMMCKDWRLETCVQSWHYNVDVRCITLFYGAVQRVKLNKNDDARAWTWKRIVLNSIYTRND